MSQRLPRTIRPENYRLEIAPDLGQNSFTGSVEVTAEIVEPTDRLVCNCADLEISLVRIDGNPAPYVLDAAIEQMTVDLGSERGPGPITFRVEFSGELNDALKGFYRSTYVDAEGRTRTIATTQFQSTDARRAFPCWDEPAMKATFDITLVVDPDLMAVSNGAEIARTPREGDGRVAIRFARTMAMSTYLVAFVVGPLEVSEPSFAGDVPVRIVHRPGQGDLTHFALEVAVEALGFFEDYYGIPYPADKLDMIALPDFAMGAMENLGCITYREILLLVDPSSATQPELQNVADVINHELAHMWFGDLVTMSWWNGIWLNEAFATFMEMKATDHFRPEWERWTSFGTSRSQAFDIDGLQATRPIEYPVVSPEDAEGMFDVLTYEKGAAVVRMLEQWLGEETFRDGIRRYLGRHQYSNTETRDLWDALEEVAGRPVTAPMETWIFQDGYPLVEVADSSLHQRRFTYSRTESDASWWIPVQVRTSAGTVGLIELDGASAALDVDLSDIATFNHAGHGFYRVKLPPERLAEIGRSGTQGLDPVERFAVIDDTWTLTLAGEVGLADFLTVLEGFRSEDDVSVWQRIIGALSFIDHVAPDETIGRLRARIGHLIGEARTTLGDAPIEGESARTRQLRGTLLRAAGGLARDASAVETARRVLATPDADAELLAASVGVIAANGDGTDFELFRNRFEGADNPQEQIRYLYALPTFEGAAQIEELTDMALDGTIRSQNAPFVLAQALMNRNHGSSVWRRIAESWDPINERFPSNTIVRMLSGIRWLTAPDVAADVANFFVDQPLPQGQKQLDQHLERLSVNVGFRTRTHEQLETALG